MESVLKKYFGFSKFRPYQKEIIEDILRGNDCLVVMATGSGKSLCYQVPPLVSRKTAVVISPLISLMQDQVMALKERGVRAEYLSSAQTNRNVHGNAESGQYDILYMTPEKACMLATSFWSRLQDSGICLVAVDEAHCISEWGHDFRVEYKHLDKLRGVLLDIPFVGLTATATEKVQGDIINSLKMKDPRIIIGSFDRENLFYGVKAFDRSIAFIDELVKEISSYVNKADSTIVYCTTIKDAEQIFSCLCQAGIRAGIYHGQMSNKAREESHRLFIRDEYLVMVATIAFGMGIDKPNIRYVAHYGCPKSLESYYQESGRCGRDGVPSTCRLYYTRSDFAKADFYCSEARTAQQRKAIMESFMAAQRYCMLTTCRRKFLLEYFGEKCTFDTCGTCDNCTSSKKESDMSREAFLLMACIHSCGGHWGLNLPIDVLRGSRSKKILEAQFDKIPFHGLGKEFPANWWKALAYQLIALDYLVETFKDLYKFVGVGPKGMQFLNSCSPDHQPPLYLSFAEEDIVDAVGIINGSSQQPFPGLSEVEERFFKLLIEKRMELAKQTGTAPYALCGDQTLRRIALTRPSTRARLANIDGVNQHFVKAYGDQLLQTVQQISQTLKLSLDGAEIITEPSVPPHPLSRKIVTVPKPNRLTPAKFEAWKMWQEDGLTLEKIANFPGRAAPIKEQTVLKYILEAAKEGCVIEWARLCREIGLTQDTFNRIQEAASKVGKERLKPIKNELPDEVSYSQIEACLVIQELGVSTQVIPHEAKNECEADEAPIKNTRALPEEVASSVVKSKDAISDFPIDIIDSKETESAIVDELHSPKKRQKLNEMLVEKPATEEATEKSVLSWLENFEDGVSLTEILNHFSGSEEKFVIDLLNQLEAEFFIFRKNNRYKVI